MWEGIVNYVIQIICTLLCLFCVRIFIVFYRINSTKKIIPRCRIERIKTIIILGSGGHTFEMLRLLKHVGEKFRPRIYISADTDQMSEKKIISFEDDLKERRNLINLEGLYVVEKVMRCREVGQSWISSFFATIMAFVPSLVLVLKHKPDLIICNGPGTCVPICVASFLLHVLAIKHINLIYVESICRVETLSLSGKLLYRLADHFLVQWPQLRKQYPRAKYLGELL